MGTFRSFGPISDLRAERLRAGLKLSEVTERAGMALAQGSRLERGLTIPRPGEIEGLHRAIYELAAERTNATERDVDAVVDAAVVGKFVMESEL